MVLLFDAITVMVVAVVMMKQLPILCFQPIATNKPTRVAMLFVLASMACMWMSITLVVVSGYQAIYFTVVMASTSLPPHMPPLVMGWWLV